MISQIIKQESFEARDLPLRLVCISSQLSTSIADQLPAHFHIHTHNSLEELSHYLTNQSLSLLPDVVLLEADDSANCFPFIEELKNNPLLHHLIIVLVAGKNNTDWKLRALELKVQDYYCIPFPIEHLVERLKFLVKFKSFRYPNRFPDLSENMEASI